MPGFLSITAKSPGGLPSEVFVCAQDRSVHQSGSTFVASTPFTVAALREPVHFMWLKLLGVDSCCMCYDACGM